MSEAGWLGFPGRRPVATIVVCAVLLLACVAMIARMRPETSLARMFPKNDPAARSLVRVLEGFSAVEELLVLVTVPEDQGKERPDPARLVAFAKRLDAAVKASAVASDLTEAVLYRADEDMRGFFEKVLVPNAIFYLDDEGFAGARRRLTREEMTKQIRQNEAMVSAPGPAAEALSKAFLQDPLRLHEFVVARLQSARPMKGYEGSDAFLSPDGKSILIRVRGKRPPSDLDFSKRITDVIGGLAAQENTDGLRIELTGAYAIAATSAGAIRHDMIINVVSAVVLLQALFVLAYRRPVRLFATAFGPVAIGVAYGFGVYGAGTTSITPLTAVVGGILAGMGIDYSVQYLSFYLSQRREGLSPSEAVEETTRGLAGPMFAAWLTSVIGFGAVACSSIPALRDFAMIGALGLGGAFGAAIFLLPAILVLTDRRTDARREMIRTPLTPLLTGLGRHRTVAVWASALVVVGAIGVLVWPGEVLPLESDLTVMHPRPNPALAAQAHLAERMGTSPDSLLVHLSAETGEGLVSLAHDVDRRLKTAEVAGAGVVGTYGLATLLPDPKVVERRKSALGEKVAAQVESDFRAAVAESIFAPQAFEPYAGFLRHILTREKAPSVSDVLAYRRLSETILPTESVRNGRPPTEAVTLVLMSGTMASRGERERAIAAVRGALAGVPGATVTGISVVARDAEQAVRHELPRFVGIAVAAVAAYLLIHFRAWRPAVLTVLPAAFGMIVTLAVLRLAGEHLNMVNLVALPLLIGIDVDYGVFLVSIARQRRDAAAAESVEQFAERIAPSAHAILMCAATTILGFGSLIWTSVPAVQSLGLAAGVGIIACVVGTFGLLVPLLARPRGGR